MSAYQLFLDWKNSMHTYLDTIFTVYNDHKPLEMIQNKPIHAAPLIFKKCYLDNKNMVTTSYTSQEKKWSWQTGYTGPPQEEKIYQ